VKALIFDFDGLLMDTETTLLESWRQAWREHGLELDQSRFFLNHGGDSTAHHHALLAAAVGPSYDPAASQDRRTAYRNDLHRTLDLAPGIRTWFARAEELGLRLAVASSSSEAWVRGHLDRVGVGARIAVTACGDEVDAHKPDPAVYLLALQRLGIPPAEAIAFEDTPHGVAAAQAAGLFCVAIPNAYVAVDRFAAADVTLPSAEAASLDEILEYPVATARRSV
jgi:HAD superfamily hydrolase (TIGR01509 family)